LFKEWQKQGSQIFFHPFFVLGAGRGNPEHAGMKATGAQVVYSLSARLFYRLKIEECQVNLTAVKYILTQASGLGRRKDHEPSYITAGPVSVRCRAA
jgi:hypothetical protein